MQSEAGQLIAPAAVMESTLCMHSPSFKYLRRFERPRHVVVALARPVALDSKCSSTRRQYRWECCGEPGHTADPRNPHRPLELWVFRL